MSAMRLTILGAGTCRLSSIRGCSGYWLDAGGLRVRLDGGPGSLHAMARFGLPWETLTHQFVSHFHLDHVGELPALLFAYRYGLTMPRSAPLDLLGPRGLRAFLDRAAALLEPKLLDQTFPIRVDEIDPGEARVLSDDVVLRVWKTPHTDESLAVRVECGGHVLGYTGDTAASPDLARFFDGVDVLIAECSFLERTRGTKHLAADDVSALARSAGARHVVAVHFYFDPDTERLAERLAAGYEGHITIGHDGMTIDV
jgi:ribonuclease BN (tRNA processing enzyme)